MFNDIDIRGIFQNIVPDLQNAISPNFKLAHLINFIVV